MFEPTFESLYNYRCPDWFRDVKFGIWSHWGPQSVPECGDWYARNMYIQGTEQYEYHLRTYGHPSKFGYKDICALWKAEKFDPDALMEKYYRAGARYFVAQATHHDHFFNYDSDLNRFNSMKVGPHKDIIGMWKNAAKKYDLPFGITEHLGASFAWWRSNKGCDSYGPYKGIPYDGNDPEYRDFYHDNYEHVAAPGEEDKWVWLTGNERFHEYWLKVMEEIIDKYKPDLLYSDSSLPFDESDIADSSGLYRYGLQAVSKLYNTSESLYGSNRAVYTNKNRNESIYRIGVLDVERSQLPDVSPVPWQSETCIGGWFYDRKAIYKTPRHIMDILIDSIAKNGTLLLNILQRPDGSIDEEADWILSELAGWFDINSEAVYGTRPYRVSGEGGSSVVIDGFREDRVDWKEDDFRFVTKDGAIYAFIMKSSGRKATIIKSLGADEVVKGVTLLGHGPVAFTQGQGELKAELPAGTDSEYPNVLKLSL